MEDSKKKMIMVVVVVACLGVAGAITFMGGSKETGIETIKAGEMLLLKCSNPDCSAVYDMEKKLFFETIQARRGEAGMTAGMPPLVCKECSKESVYEAIKCEKCGVTFFVGSVRGDFSDRCTECGYSKKEERRKTR